MTNVSRNVKLVLMKTLAQVSREFNIPLTTLREAVYSGRLSVQKFGRDLVIDTASEAFKQFLENYRPREEKK